MTYQIALERGDLNYHELEPNYRAHYEETCERFARDGLPVSPFNPRLKEYFEAFSSGYLLNYVARHEGRPVGHCNVYLTNDMHNSDLIAQEDVLYVVPEHRNGLGKKLVQAALADLKTRGVKRVLINPVTDLRVAKIWKRMGFQEVSSVMVYRF
ncbi:Acetyltransferase (GNAT) family protein [Roseivivax jejudonensis]|uniref:Acetyltransferase (GNAT) family protein n=1 Tax=Roseivivax jejudonensis TaxID=1529041 RepID=A0A1X7ABF2_9RHOB|nr:GNAT family N-acetyltransferase [Roseivivax jejudonensis]SLN74740.1 Acetyltransferase (GNAT) family protein [Roseivivax jejudonensis]